MWKSSFRWDGKADRCWACPLFGSLFGEGEREVGQEFALEIGLLPEFCGPFGVVDPIRVGLGQGGAADDLCGPAHEAGGGREISKLVVSPGDVAAGAGKVGMVWRQGFFPNGQGFLMVF